MAPPCPGPSGSFERDSIMRRTRPAIHPIHCLSRGILRGRRLPPISLGTSHQPRRGPLPPGGRGEGLQPLQEPSDRKSVRDAKRRGAAAPTGHRFHLQVAGGNSGPESFPREPGGGLWPTRLMGDGPKALGARVAHRKWRIVPLCVGGEVGRVRSATTPFIGRSISQGGAPSSPMAISVAINAGKNNQSINLKQERPL